MRFIGLLLSLAILGYVINIYLDSSATGTDDGESYTSRPKQTIDNAEETAGRLNKVLEDQQKKLREAD